MDINETTLPALTRIQIARYAGAVRDFNPVHVDEEFAKAAGLPSVIAHGPLTVTRGLDAIVAQIGAGRVRSLSARLKSPHLPGEALTVVGTDAGVELRNQSGTVLAEITLTIEPEGTQ
jgi:acyl dehydratase